MENLRKLIKKKLFYVISIIFICLLFLVCASKHSKTINNYTKRLFKYNEDEVNYRVEYYYTGDNQDPEIATVYKTSNVGTIIETYEPDFSLNDYSIIATLNLPLTISENEENNVIKIYYTDNTNPSEPSVPVTYTLKYYYDGSNIGSETLSGNSGDSITKETIEQNISNHSVLDGTEYKFYKLSKDSFKLSASETNELDVIYLSKSANIQYTVDFYYDNGKETVLDPTKTRVVSANLDDTIILEENDDIQRWIEENKISTGESNSYYEFDYISPEELTISDDILENNISVFYKKYYDVEYKLEFYYDGEHDESLDRTFVGKSEDDISIDTEEVENSINENKKDGFVFYRLANANYTLDINKDNTIKAYYLSEKIGYIIEFKYYIVEGNEGEYVLDPEKTVVVEAELDSLVNSSDIDQVLIESNKGDDYEGYTISPSSITITDDLLSNKMEVKYHKGLEEVPYVIEYYYDGIKDNSKSEIAFGHEGDIIDETTVTSYIANNMKTGYRYYATSNSITLVKIETGTLYTIKICYISDTNSNYRLEFYYLQNGEETLDITKTRIVPISTSTTITQSQIQNIIDENNIFSYKFDRMTVNAGVAKIYYTNIYNYQIELYYNGVKSNNTLSYTAYHGTIINFEDPFADETEIQDINLQTNEKETINDVISSNMLAGYKLLTIDADTLEGEEFQGTLNIPLEITDDNGIIKIFYVSDINGFTELFYYNNVIDYTKVKKISASLGSNITYNLIENDVLANTKTGYELDEENTEIKQDGSNPVTVEEDTFVKIHYIGIEQNYRIDYYMNNDGDQEYVRMDESDEIIGRFEQKVTYDDIESYILDRMPKNYRLAIADDFTEEDREEILGGYDWSTAQFNGITNLPLVISLNDNESTVNEENVINVYFTGGFNVNYRVEYYITENGHTEFTGDTTVSQAKFGDIIDNYPFKNISGYKFEYAQNYPLEVQDSIDEETGDNIIKAYYVKDVRTGYRIEYYYNGEMDRTKTEQIEKSNNTVISTLEYDKIEDGYARVAIDALPITISRNQVKTVKVYYVTDVDNGYKLEFYIDNVLDLSKTRLIESEIGDIIYSSEVIDNIPYNSYSIAVNEGGNEVIKYTYDENNYDDTELLTISENIENNVIKVYADVNAEYTIKYYYDNVLKEEHTNIANIGDEINLQETEENGIKKYTIGEESFNEYVTYNNVNYVFSNTSDLPIIIKKGTDNVIEVYYRNVNNIENDSYTIEYYYNGEINGEIYDYIVDSDIVSQINNTNDEEGLKTLLADEISTYSVLDGENYNFYKIEKDALNATVKISFLPNVDNGYKMEFFYKNPSTSSYEVDHFKTKMISKTGDVNDDDDEILEAQETGIKDNYIFENISTNGGFPFTAGAPDEHTVNLYYDYTDGSIIYYINYYYNGVKEKSESIRESNLTVEYINNKITQNSFFKWKQYEYSLIQAEDLADLDSENNIINVYYTRNIANGAYLRFYYYDYYEGQYIENTDLQEPYEANINDSISYNQIEEIVERNQISGYYFDRTEPELPYIVDNTVEDNFINIYYMMDIAEGYTIDFYYDDIIEKTSVISLYDDNTHSVNDEIDLTDSYLQDIINENSKEGYRFSSIAPYPFTISEVFSQNRLKIYYVSEPEIPVNQQIRYKVEYFYDGDKDKSKTEVVIGKSGSQITTYRDNSTEDFYLDREENVPLVLSSGDETTNIIKVFYKARAGESGELEGNSSYTIRYYYKDGNSWFYRYQIEDDLTENIAVDAGTQITEDIIEDKINNNLILNGKIYYCANKSNLPLTVDEDPSKNIINVYYIWTRRYAESSGDDESYNFTIEYYYEKTDDDNNEVFEIGDLEYVENDDKKEIQYEDIKDRINNHINYTGTDLTLQNKEYELLRIEYLPYELSNEESLNCIEVYYIPTDKKELNYKVQYYLEGALLETNITRKIVSKTASDEIEVDIDSINVDNKYEGYVCTSIKPNPIPNKVMSGTEIEVHYANVNTKTIGYDINYYLNGELQEDDTDKVRLTVLENASDEISGVLSRVNTTDKYEGYVCIGTNPSTLSDIAHDGDVIEIYYGEVNTKVVGYDVEYYTDEVLNDVVQVRKQVDINSTENEIEVSSDTVNTIDKYGEIYRFDSTIPDPVPEKVENGSTIKVYYVSTGKKIIGYYINYYLSGTLKDTEQVRVLVDIDDTNEIIELDESKINKNKYYGYVFEKTDPEILPDTIRNGESIDVYYVENNTKTVGYDVQYYADGVLKDTDKQRIVVNKNDPNPTIDVNKSLINLENKYPGYVFEKADPTIIPDTVNDGYVIKVYYVEDGMKTIGYDVNYYIDDTLVETLQDRKIVSKESNETISINRNLISENRYSGYIFNKIEPEVIPDEVDTEVGANIFTINIYYNSDGKKTLYYDVAYYVDDELIEVNRITKSVDEDSENQIAIEDGSINITNKYGNCTFLRVNPEDVLTREYLNNGDLVEVYYKLNNPEEEDCKYKIEYYYDGSLGKTDIINCEPETTIYENTISDRIEGNKGENFYKLTVLNVPLLVHKGSTQNTIKVFYVSDNPNDPNNTIGYYKIEYYYNGSIDETKTEVVKSFKNEKIEIDNIRGRINNNQIENYNYLTTANVPLLVTDNIENNVIKVYYVTEEVTPESLVGYYKIEYYYNNVIDTRKTEVLTTVKGNTIKRTDIDEQIEYNRGAYNVLTVGNIPLYVSENIDNNIIKVFYVENNPAINSKFFKIQYYYNEIIDTSKTELIGTAKDVITQDDISDEIDNNTLDGYYLLNVANVPLTLSSNTDNNIIKVYYVDNNPEDPNSNIGYYKIEYYYDNDINNEITEIIRTEKGITITRQDIDNKIDLNKGTFRIQDVVNVPLVIRDSIDENTIKVYYKTISPEDDIVSYKIQYYYNENIDPEKTETVECAKGAIITKDSIQSKIDSNQGEYDYVTTLNVPLTVTDNIDNNVIKVYYKTNNPDDNTKYYKIEYYYDNVIDTGRTELVETTKDTIERADIDSRITENKLEGYNLLTVANVPLTVTENADNNVIKVYYVKDEPDNPYNQLVTYKIQYFYDGTNTKTDELEGPNGATITREDINARIEANKGGYTLELVQNVPLVLTENTDNNVIKVYYIDEGSQDEKKTKYQIEYYYDSVLNAGKSELIEVD